MSVQPVDPDVHRMRLLNGSLHGRTPQSIRAWIQALHIEASSGDTTSTYTPVLKEMLGRWHELEPVFAALLKVADVLQANEFVEVCVHSAATYGPARQERLRQAAREAAALRAQAVKRARSLAESLGQLATLASDYEVHGGPMESVSVPRLLLETRPLDGRSDGASAFDLSSRLVGLSRQFDRKHWPAVTDLLETLAAQLEGTPDGYNESAAAVAVPGGGPSGASGVARLLLRYLRNQMRVELSDAHIATLLSVILLRTASEAIGEELITRVRQRGNA